MTIRKLSRIEVIKAHALMTQHLMPSDREGFFKYQFEWSDARIAQELNPAIQATSIGNLRSELFGKLETLKNITQDDNQRIAELQKLYENILACYGELEVKYNKLIDTLCLNKVADVKHLKTTVKE